MTYLTKSLIALIIAGATLVVGATMASAQETPALPEDSTTTEIDLSIIDDDAGLVPFTNPFSWGAHSPWPGLTLYTCLNAQCDEVDNEGNPAVQPIGGLFFVGSEDPNCDTASGFCKVIGYCIEADTPLNLDEQSEFYTIDADTLDPRAVYLAWRYDADFHGGLDPASTNLPLSINGNNAPVFAAVQALIWGYVSDVEAGTSVWDGYNYTDAVTAPTTGFEIVDGIAPDATWLAHLGSIYNGTASVPYLYDNDPQGVIDAANAYIVSLHAEATAKQGPWVLSENADSTGLTLMGSVGPISGEIITFDNGVTAVTDSNGFVSWVDGSLSADVEMPGKIFRTDGLAVQSEGESQNAIVVQGKLITVTRSAVPVEEPVTEDPVDETPETKEPVTEDPVDETPETEEPVTEDPVDETPETEEPVTEDPVDETPETEELEEIAITDETPETEEELPLTGGMHLYMVAIALSLLVAGSLLLASSKIKAAHKVIA